MFTLVLSHLYCNTVPVRWKKQPSNNPASPKFPFDIGYVLSNRSRTAEFCHFLPFPTLLKQHQPHLWDERGKRKKNIKKCFTSIHPTKQSSPPAEGGREGGRGGGSDIMPVSSSTTDERAPSPSGTNTEHNLSTGIRARHTIRAKNSLIHSSIHSFIHHKPIPKIPITNFHSKKKDSNPTLPYPTLPKSKKKTKKQTKG